MSAPKSLQEAFWEVLESLLPSATGLGCEWRRRALWTSWRCMKPSTAIIELVCASCGTWAESPASCEGHLAQLQANGGRQETGEACAECGSRELRVSDVVDAMDS